MSGSVDRAMDEALRPEGWRATLGGAARLVRFFSRLPVPALPFEADPHCAPDFRAAPLLLPLAGLIIGAPGALAFGLAAWAGLPALMAAGIGIAAAALCTGALHEDGLADTMDGLAGGRTPERRLEIMRDSRIGSFGATALALALLLRASGLAALPALLGVWGAALAMLAAAQLSRTIALMPMALMPAARSDGAAATRPSPGVFGAGLALAITIAAAIGWTAGAGWAALPAGAACGLALAAAMTVWARRAIGGQTGDIAGACQQLAEIGIYLGLLMVLNGGRG